MLGQILFYFLLEIFIGRANFKNDGERSDPSKYRPISLFPIVSKIFESFINDSLTKHLDITGLFSDIQYGFCAFRSTADILTVLSEHIYNLLDAGGETRAIALDISKASKVCHARLLHKLKAYGLVGPILKGPTLFLFFINDRPKEVLSRIGIYAEDTTLYSTLAKSVFLEKVESAGELEVDVCSIVEWGDGL